MGELGNHLWQSTAFAAAVAVASLALRRNRARVRYWLWLAASLKFLVPFSPLVSFGARLEGPPAASSILPAIRVEQISTTFAPVPAIPSFLPAARTPSGTRWWPTAALAIWSAGMLFFGGGWLRQWFVLRALRRRATAVPLDFPIPVAVAPGSLEPGVFGLFRPTLLLPEGLAHHLAPEQFESILAHELCHVRSRDNLTAALHLAVATVFWFHPAIWWIGRRLIEERERACDEAVLGQGSRPEAYAQGILSICKFYREATLPCASGVTGADLKKRIREIMTARVSYRLTLLRKLMLTTAAVVAVSLPVVIGVLRAQTLPPAPAYGYEVVSIRRSAPGETNSRLGPGAHGGITVQNNTVMQLLTFAYDARTYQFVNAPGWVESDRFDINLTPDRPEVSPSKDMSREQMQSLFNRHRQRMQAVLRDRFGLILRAENRDMPIYALTIARNGHKLLPPKDPKAMHMSTSRNQITGTAVNMKMLTDSLSMLTGRFVRNETGLDGPYDLKLEWTPDTGAPSAAAADPDDVAGATLFTALTEQLGLKLESRRGPVPVFVVEKIDRPTEN